MKLESLLKHFSPQGMHISDSIKGTSPDRLTGSDVKAAIGTTSTRARFGLAAFLGKAGVSKSDEQLAVQMLVRYAMEVAPKNVRKAAGGQFSNCMLLLAQFAFAEYLRVGGNCRNLPQLQRYRKNHQDADYTQSILSLGQGSLLGQPIPCGSSVRLGKMDRSNGDFPG